MLNVCLPSEASTEGDQMQEAALQQAYDGCVEAIRGRVNQEATGAYIKNGMFFSTEEGAAAKRGIMVTIMQCLPAPDDPGRLVESALFVKPFDLEPDSAGSDGESFSFRVRVRNPIDDLKQWYRLEEYGNLYSSDNIRSSELRISPDSVVTTLGIVQFSANGVSLGSDVLWGSPNIEFVPTSVKQVLKGIAAGGLGVELTDLNVSGCTPKDIGNAREKVIRYMNQINSGADRIDNSPDPVVMES